MSTDPEQPQTGATHPVTEDPAVAAFLERLHAVYRTPPGRDVAHRHLELILGEVATRGRATAPWWRARLAVGRIARRAAAVGAVKLALSAGLAAAATGSGLAATGNLPSAVQHDVAEVLGRVGVELPDPAAAVVDDTPAGGELPPGLSDRDGHPPGPQNRPDEVPPAERGDSDRAGSTTGDDDDARDRARQRRSERPAKRPDGAGASGAEDAGEAADPDRGAGHGSSGDQAPDDAPDDAPGERLGGPGDQRGNQSSGARGSEPPAAGADGVPVEARTGP